MIFFAEYGAIAHFLLENHRVFTKEAGVALRKGGLFHAYLFHE